MHQKELELLKSKGSDYSNSEDILKNFKEVGEICKLLNIDSRTSFGTHMFYILIKIQRLCNLINNGKKANNESVEDTIVDLRNYAGLLNCSLLEEEKVAVESPGINRQVFEINVKDWNHPTWTLTTEDAYHKSYENAVKEERDNE